MLKRSGCVRLTVVLTAVLALSSIAFAQEGGQGGGQRPAPTPEQSAARAARAAAKAASKKQPFDPHDLNGVWLSEKLENPNTGVPPRTPAGEAAFKLNKPAIGSGDRNGAVPLVESNDPIHLCDPPGFPRNLITIVRAIQFVQTKNQMIQLFLFNEIWRIIWTDGRAPMKDEDAQGLPRWSGYSVGRWDGDTFVVETNGLDERSWLDSYGDPHSDVTTYEERWHRVDHDTMELSMTITDPKIYTKPWVVPTELFDLQPELDLRQQEICTPSEMAQYQKIIVDPEAIKK
jgi:hypothetical protein